MTDRRTFLKSAGLLTAAAALLSPSQIFARAKGVSKPSGKKDRFVSRTPLKHAGQGIDTVAYDEAFQLADSHLLIVNCTPVGMYPHTEESPWKTPAVLTPKHLCYDLIYNPERTRFLLDATERGAATANGLAMLHRQADMAYTIWQA